MGVDVDLYKGENVGEGDGEALVVAGCLVAK